MGWAAILTLRGAVGRPVLMVRGGACKKKVE